MVELLRCPQKAEEKETKKCFLQFLSGVLNPAPDKRWTPRQAAGNPFISGAPFDSGFVPVEDFVPSSTIPLQSATPSASDVAPGCSLSVATADDPDFVLPDAQPDKMQGRRSHPCANMPFPNAKRAEGYRPTIDQIFKDIFHGEDRSGVLAATTKHNQKQQAKGPPPSPASSPGSTSTHGHARGPRNSTGYRKSRASNPMVQKEPPKGPQGCVSGTAPATCCGAPAHGNVSPNSAVPLKASGPISVAPQDEVP